MSFNRCSTLLALALCAMLAACGGKNNDNNDSSNGTSNTPNNESNQPNNESNDPNNESNDPNNDPCADVAECTAGSSCNGDSSVVCAADADGCLVETTTDCAAGGQVCMGGACVDPMDCTDDAACAGQADGDAFCTGDTLTVCATNAAGCLVANTEDCAAGGQTCEDGTPMCVSACTDDIECEGLADGDTYCAADGTGFTACALNAQGCLEATDTACNAGEVCDATGAAAMCAMSCPESQATYSCADAGMMISVDTAAGTSAVNDNGCNDFGDDYSANELFFVFSDAANQDVVIEYTYDNANITTVDAFALASNGVCTDPSLTCEASNFNFGSGTPDTLEFGAVGGQSYYLLFEPFATTETTPIGISITCTAPVCGDGVLGAGEACDDMNTANGDGCDMNCAVEQGWICDSGEPSTCIQEICGDGVITASEECDDMNTADGDGCDMNCAVEQDYICTGEPSMCVPDVCGDGTLSPNETCDDGNTADGDGCDMECNVEFGWECDDTGANCAMVPSIGTFAPGDAIADTSIATAENECEQRLITFSDTVVLDGSVTGTTGDPDLYIFSETATFVREEDFGPSESVNNVIIPAGTYLVIVCGYDADDTYTLSLSTAGLTTTDIGSFAAAAAIADQTGALSDSDSVFYEITFSDHVFLSASLTADTGDANLRVTWPSGALIASLANTGDETLTDLALPAGTYTIAVDAAVGGGDIGTYTLSLSTTALPVTEIGTFAAGDTIADTVGGTLLAGESVYYTITFSTDVTVSGSLDATSTGDPDFLIYSSTAFGFGAFADGNETFMDEDLPAQTYLIRIDAYAPVGDLDGFTLSLTAN